MSQENKNQSTYSHQSKIRCGKCLSLEVKSIKTICGGRIKVWRCTKCPRIIKTVGNKI